jgi:hypothetical protein
MITRYLPYSSRPIRTMSQLLSDLIVVGWTWLWVLIGLAVHTAVATIAKAGRQVQSGANGVAGNLDSAGDTASRVPLVGDALKKPLTAAGSAAHEIAQAGHSIDTTATWLAVLLGLAVASPPILALVLPWLFLRLRFFLRKLTILGLATSPAGIELLALRALANRPLRRLTAVNPDPVGAWRRSDPVAVLGLAALEARSAGISFRALARSQRY